MEQLTKAGLFRLAVECTQDYYKLSSIFQTTPVQRGLAPKLGLNRLELARLRKNQGGRAFLEWLQFEKQTGKPISDFAIQWMCKSILTRNSCNSLQIGCAMGRSSIT